MKFDIASFSEVGPRRENEDALLVHSTSDRVFLAVADGLGGHGGGREAADIAIALAKDWPSTGSLDGLPLVAHEAILARQLVSEYAEMATTLTAVRITGTRLEGVHVGDTRCAVQRGSGIRKLTVAHTEAQRLLDARKLTKEEFRQYPRRNILDSALGAREALKTQNFDFIVEPGDKIILTSDGVHERIPLQAFLQLAHGTADEICGRVQSEMAKVGAEDNFSCIVAIAEA